MKQGKLKIGRFSYSNLFPIFYMLERECDCSSYEFVEGAPSTLNRMMRNGEIDISPSSSIEYLRYDIYEIIKDHSISSVGPIKSIFLFSKKPLERLAGHTVLTSSQSETSVALLKIILKKFYGMDCLLNPADLTFQNTDFSSLKAEAFLLIGDDALRGVKSENLKVKSLYTHIYDLGELWHKNTCLPFTFALWIHKKACCIEKPELLKKFRKDLDTAKELATKNLREIASVSPLRNILSEDEIVSYWENISFDFREEHKKGLELFRKYSEELGLI